MDTTKEIRALFADMEDDHNYQIDKTPDSVYVCYSPNEEVAAGPIFIMKKIDTFWKLTEVYFGK